MPFGTAPSTHIVKQSHVRLSGIVANEQLCLRTAKILGIDVPESFIISVGTGEHILFATKRFDRLMQEDSRVIDGKKSSVPVATGRFCTGTRCSGFSEI